MRSYRAYLIDREGHIVRAPEIVEAENDADALERAGRYVDGYDVEVWEHDRRVGTLKRIDR